MLACGSRNRPCYLVVGIVSLSMIRRGQSLFAWGRALLLAGAVALRWRRACCSVGSRTSRCRALARGRRRRAVGHARRRCDGAEVAPDPRRPRPVSSAATCSLRSTAQPSNRRRRHRVSASQQCGHAAVLHAVSPRGAAGARGLAGAGAARQLDVFRARGRRPLHAAGRRVGAAAPAATIRRRCTSSGCASRSSASSPSRSTAR